MGYSTVFEGRLKFLTPPTSEQLRALDGIMTEDCRDHPEWDAPNLYYVDLKVCADGLGLEWDGSEKTYGLDGCVNVLLTQMRKTWPDFGLEGEMRAYGDAPDDHWILAIKDGIACRVPATLQPQAQTVRCPHCSEEFTL